MQEKTLKEIDREVMKALDQSADALMAVTLIVGQLDSLRYEINKLKVKESYENIPDEPDGKRHL